MTYMIFTLLNCFATYFLQKFTIFLKEFKLAVLVFYNLRPHYFLIKLKTILPHDFSDSVLREQTRNKKILSINYVHNA